MKVKDNIYREQYETILSMVGHKTLDIDQLLGKTVLSKTFTISSFSYAFLLCISVVVLLGLSLFEHPSHYSPEFHQSYPCWSDRKVLLLQCSKLSHLKVLFIFLMACFCLFTGDCLRPRRTSTHLRNTCLHQCLGWQWQPSSVQSALLLYRGSWNSLLRPRYSTIPSSCLGWRWRVQRRDQLQYQERWCRNI